MQTFNSQNLISSFNAANARYVASEATPNVNASGVNPDILTAINCITKLSAGASEALPALQVHFGTSDMLDFIAKRAGVKACKRFAQFVDYAVTKDVNRIDAATFAGFAGAIMLSSKGIATIDNEVFKNIVSGKGTINTGDKMRGVSVANVRKLGGAVKGASAATQLSRTFGVNGFLTATGAVALVANRPLRASIDVSHPFSQFFVGLVNELRAGTLDLIVEKAGKGK